MTKIPQRTCVVSRQKLDKSNLFRVVVNKLNEVSIDIDQKLPGRGVYLSKDFDIITKAKKNKILNKKLNCDVSQDIYDNLLKLLEREL